MYFVVFLIEPKKNVVVPANWIQGCGNYWEKFVNRGLNKTQKHRIFYSENPLALDDFGGPKAEYEPNFSLDADVFPNEGCYMGKIVKFLFNFVDACTSAIRRRGVEPAIYNSQRLLERPLPETSNTDRDNGEQNRQDDTHQDEQNRQEENQSDNDLYEYDSNDGAYGYDGYDDDHGIDFEHLVVNDSARQPNDSADFQSNSTNTNVETDPLHLVPKVEIDDFIPIVQPSHDNIIALDSLMEELSFTVIEVDDIEITINNKTGFAKPFNASSDGLIKREDDIVSGALPFNETKKGRIYKLGKYNLEVPSKVIDTFKDWNSHPEKQNDAYDKRFVQALLLICVDAENVAKQTTKGKLGQECEQFVDGFILVRASMNSDRIARMQKYKLELLKDMN